MIKRFCVEGLNGRTDKQEYTFNNDINIVTGRNGSGKTTFLKLLWYILSGNLNIATEELVFDTAEVETESYIIKVYKNRHYRNRAALLKQYDHKSLEVFDMGYDVIIIDLNEQKIILETEGKKVSIWDAEKFISALDEDSLFFPTFRRIEGGFSTRDKSLGYDRSYPYRESERLEVSVKSLANSISRTGHKFITSVSTVDIVDLLTQEYADISKQVNEKYIEFSKSIEEKIKTHSKHKNLPDKDLLNEANDILSDIEQNIYVTSSYRKEKFQPFTVLDELIEKLFYHKGIKVSESITLGKSKEAMISESLSAGEKQMLSFIIYNTFYKNSIFIIDEPEISLHVDWQRILMSTLLSQESGNQFIVATHSPFIYSKYVDKEIVLNPDRGGY